MWFKKIPIPPQKVIGITEGEEDLTSQFSQEIVKPNGITEGWAVHTKKNLLWKGYGYFLEQQVTVELCY